MGPVGEQEETEAKVTLLDFLYQDKPKIASFYAQLFSGNLIAVTKSQERAKAKDLQYAGKVAVAEASRQTHEENSSQITEQIDPHDYSSLLLLSKLGLDPIERVDRDMLGKIVLLRGSLKIRNYIALKTVFPSVLKSGIFDGQLSQFSFARDPNQQSAKKQKEQMRSFFGAVFDLVPAGLEMEVTDFSGTHVVGPIKPECLNQSPDDILRTYGENLDGESFVLGILGYRKMSSANTGQNLRGMMDDISRLIREAYAPGDNYVITPVLIYREIVV